MADTWQTEEDGQPTELKYKAHCALEGSEAAEWGIVKWVKGCVNHIPADAEIVGTWSKYSDGSFWISLTTPLEALKDKATQLFAELSIERQKELQGLATGAAAPKRRSSKATPKVVDEGPSEEMSSIRALRDSLKKQG